MTVNVPRGRLLSMLRKGDAAVVKAIALGKTRGMRRGVAELKQRSPVSDGRFRSSWRATDDAIVNDAPYAGVIERGARPHPVSQEGIEAIMDWVGKNIMTVARASGPGAVKQRRIGLRKSKNAQAEIRSIAYAIAAKIKKEGQEPTWMVRNAIPRLRDLLRDEIDRSLSDAAARSVG